MGRTGIVGILVKDVEDGTARQEEKRETKSRVRKIKRKVHYKSLYDLYFFKIDILFYKLEIRGILDGIKSIFVAFTVCYQICLSHIFSVGYDDFRTD